MVSETGESLSLGEAPAVQAFYHPPSSTLTYVVQEPGGKHCAIIDPVLDFTLASARTGHDSADRLLAFITEHELQVEWILETHAHADHLSAAPYLQAELDAKIGIGAGICEVQELVKPIFALDDDFPTTGEQFNQLFDDGDRFDIGALTGRVIATPGHTPACVTYVIGDTAFVGDTLFMPDGGTARADFPGGSATTLYRSLRKILSLPAATRLFICHDYQPGGREVAWETTVAEQLTSNIHIRDGVDEATFVAMRNERDATLSVPDLLLPSIQVNARAGHLPPPDAQRRRFLKLPIDVI